MNSNRIKNLSENEANVNVITFLFHSSESLQGYNMDSLTLLVLDLQYKRNMWEGRYRHCLQAF
jgi:hypothetical protein